MRASGVQNLVEAGHRCLDRVEGVKSADGHALPVALGCDGLSLADGNSNTTRESVTTRCKGFTSSKNRVVPTYKVERREKGCPREASFDESPTNITKKKLSSEPYASSPVVA